MRRISPLRHTDTLAKLGVFVAGWFLLLDCRCSTLAAPQQEAHLKTSVDATTITIGEVVTLQLEVRRPESLKLAFPQVGATLGEWVVRGTNRLPTKAVNGGGAVSEVLALQLTIYKTGEFEIPKIQIEAVRPGGERSILTSEPVKIKVGSVLTGNQDTLKDLKPQAEIAADYKPFLLFLAALGSAAYLIYRLVQRLKRRRKALPAILQDRRTAEEIARQAIRQLLARKLIEQGYLKEFYLELSEIVKRFLGSKMGIPSLERTTEEFTEDLRQTAIQAGHYRMIRQFLDDCDLVKFAKYRPGAEEIQQIIARSSEIIDAVVAGSPAEPILGVAK
jgi:hypothetical protein